MRSHTRSVKQLVRQGFTLVELLVVIAIIGILIGMLLPAVQSVREASRKAVCQNNGRQMGLALTSFQSTFGNYPPASRKNDAGTQMHHWLSYILPYVEQANLQNQYDFSKQWNHADNQSAISTHVPTFRCPSTPGIESRSDVIDASGKLASASDYGTPSAVAAIVYDAGFADPVEKKSGMLNVNSSNTMDDISDGLSNTLFMVECAGRPLFYAGRKLGPANNTPGGNNLGVTNGRTRGAGWADPDGVVPLHGFTEDGLSVPGPRAINATNNNEAYSFHTNGIVSAFGDGHVKYLSDRIEISVYSKLITMAGEEIVTSEDY